MKVYTQPIYYCAECNEELSGVWNEEKRCIVYRHYQGVVSQCPQYSSEFKVFITQLVRTL